MGLGSGTSGRQFRVNNNGIGTGTDVFTVDDGGAVTIYGLRTTGVASGKSVVCVDTATGRLYASSSGTSCAN